MKKVNLLSKAEMKNVLGGKLVEDEDGDSLSGSCGINIYGTHGNKIDEERNYSKSEAIAAAQAWNSNHQTYCTSNCNAIAKWCCQSC